MYFEFEKLDVYGVSLDFVAAAEEVAQSLPKDRRYLKDQLRRGANSIAANLAEGIGEFSPAEKARFYRISRRSAVECASHLLACRRLSLVEDELIAKGLDQLLRIVAMQTSMIKSVSGKIHARRQRQRARARARALDDTRMVTARRGDLRFWFFVLRST